MRHLLVALLCAAMSIPAVAAQAPDFAKLEKTAAAELVETRTPGAAIAIVKDGRVVYSKGFGVASVETGAPVTAEMLFRLGSSTKVFNGVALATLAERGKLDLDRPISTYVKGLDPSVGRVTAAQLLSHTAGIRDFAAPATSNDEAAFAPAIKGYRADVFFTEPGAIHSYSSPGYWLAGVVLEEVAGRPYADAMAETVFAPLGMERSTFRPLAAMTYPMAVGHAVESEKGPAVVRPAANNTVMWPGGSIYSSAVEMARFANALVGGPGLSHAVAARAGGRHAVIPGSDGAAHYGFGLIGYEDRGVRILQHGGFSRGYGSMLVLAPDHGFAIVVLTNRSGSTLPKTVTAATELFLPFKAEAAPPAVAPPGPLAAYAGVYEHAPSRWEVAARDGKLFVTAEGKERELVHVSGHRFTAGDEQIVFVPNAAGTFEHIFLGLYAARRTGAIGRR